MDNYLFLPRVVAAALSDIAFAGAVGLSLVSFLVLPREGKPTTSRPMLVCVAALLVAVLALIYLTTATMIATAAPSEVLAQLRSVALETHAGRSLLVNASVTLLLVGLSVIPRTRWPMAATLILLTASRATIGHAASYGDFTIAEFVQFTHLLSITIWSGLILAASVVVLPKLPSDAIASFTRKLSRTVTVALVFILASGAYNSYRGIGGTFAPVLHTQWGILLCVKLMLVVAALMLGFLNRRILNRNAALTEPQIAQLMRQIRAEAVLMLLILTASAALANSPPAV